MNVKMQISHFLIIAALALAFIALMLMSCGTKTEKKRPESHVVHPLWSQDAVIYEVNVRQFTPEGTFKAFAEHLPRLKALGVDILWFMPIHPIGEKNRKGELGSYYSVQDYTGVNAEFGEMQDFKDIVVKAHELGMFVILDWVANHTAWDHAWITDHPEWYTKDENGEMIAPFDWTDVAELNYDNKDMRKAMIDALKFWISEADIDGYRCDVAAEVPTDFWNDARAALDSLKPVFMLAESEEPEHHTYAFDMSYAWELHHLMNGIAKGEKSNKDLDAYFVKQDTLYPEDAYRMLFITNHDENSWNGTVIERMGEGGEAFAVLTYTLPGMPMIYSGQEAGLDKRLRFFAKDTIPWGDYKYEELYTKLGQLRKDNPALWSGKAGGEMKRIESSDEGIYAFKRKRDDNELLVIVNLSHEERSFTLKSNELKKECLDYFSGKKLSLSKDKEITLDKWHYKVLLLHQNQ
jgi:glycosidase